MSEDGSARGGGQKRHWRASCARCKKQRKRCSVSGGSHHSDAPCDLCVEKGKVCVWPAGPEDQTKASETGPRVAKRTRTSVPDAFAPGASTSGSTRPPASESGGTLEVASVLSNLGLPPGLSPTAQALASERVTTHFSPTTELPTEEPAPSGHQKGSSLFLTYDQLANYGVGAVATVDVPTDSEKQTMLEVYWVWQAPQHMPVDRRLFERDMASNPPGPWFSPLLLNAIYAHASRHATCSIPGERFAEKARILLAAELTAPSKITTIQALFILGGRDCALGRTGQGWLLSGMAFRMLQEMGIHLGSGDALLDHLPAEEQYMRSRILWSAHCWDGFFSLTLGKSPTLELRSNYVAPPSFKENIAERGVWAPGLVEYPPHAAMEAETFTGSCLLYLEIKRIIRHVYQPNEDTIKSSTTFVGESTERLVQWRHHVSSQVILDTRYLPITCPPPHTLTLNLLYRTAWILLLRNSTQGSDRDICMERSEEMHRLFRLHEKTFGLQNLTYLFCYCAYVSATVDVSEALSDNLLHSMPAVARLELTLKVLTKGAIHTPGIQRAIHLLKQRLQGRHDRSGRGSVTPALHQQSAAPSLASMDLSTLLGEHFNGSLEGIDNLPSTSLAGQHRGGLPAVDPLATIEPSFDELFNMVRDDFVIDGNFQDYFDASTWDSQFIGGDGNTL